MLGKIADFYEDEVDQAVANLTAFLEPMMMVFLGVASGLSWSQCICRFSRWLMQSVVKLRMRSEGGLVSSRRAEDVAVRPTSNPYRHLDNGALFPKRSALRMDVP